MKYTSEELKVWFPVVCPKCGWKGLSRDTKGGNSIADTGDYSDIVCPVCLDNYETGEWIPVNEDMDYYKENGL